MTHEARRLGTTDTFIAPLALGAMIMGTRTPEEESRRILDHFVGEVAPRFRGPDGASALAMLDTADCYCWWNVPGEPGGHSESLLGRWFADTARRDAVYLTTKGSGRLASFDGVWHDDGTANWDVAYSRFVGAGATVLEEALAGSLERLGVDRIDLYYVHVDDQRTPLEETLAALVGFVRDGRIGAYGWSNVRTWRLAQIRAICDVNRWPQPVALQQRHSYLRRRAGVDDLSTVDVEQLSYLRAYPDLQLVAYSPILNGVYGSAEKRSTHPLMVEFDGPDSDARLAAVGRLAREVGCTPNQAVLAWMMAVTDPQVVPLVGPRTWDQYRELVEALEIDLTPDQLAALVAAGA